MHVVIADAGGLAMGKALTSSTLEGAVCKHYDEDQVAALVCLVAMINAANRMGVIVRQKGGSYQPGMFDSMMS